MFHHIIVTVVFLMSVPRQFLCFILLCVSMVLYMAFVLSLFVRHLSFSWCLGKAVLRDCDISFLSSHIFDMLFIYFSVLIHGLIRGQTVICSWKWKGKF